MPLEIDAERVAALGGVIVMKTAIAKFQQELADHASTVDVPAPVAPNSIIEKIVREYGGAFRVVESPAGIEE